MRYLWAAALACGAAWSGVAWAQLPALRHWAASCPRHLKQRLATYAMAAADQLKETEKNGAFRLYYEEASDLFLENADPEQGLLLIMIEATELKNAGKLAEARKRFHEVPSTYGLRSETQEFTHYWRARAEAADCLYRIYLAGGKKDPAVRAQAARELEEALAKAAASRPPQLDGMAAAAYYLAELWRGPAEKDAARALEVLKLFDTKLADVEEYRDAALSTYAVVLAEEERHGEAREKFTTLRMEFPESVDTARAAYDLFAFYAATGDAARAAPYAAAYLEHPIVKGNPVDDELLFEAGLAMADSGRREFLPRARAIFEAFANSPDREKRIKAGTGLVKIYVAEQRYEEAVELGTELLVEARPDEDWVPGLYRDMKNASMGLMEAARKQGDTKNVVRHLSDAEAYMREVVKRVWSARSAIREDLLHGRATPENFRAITIVAYRYYLELLLIWTKQARYRRVNGTIALLFKDGAPLLPADLVATYEKLYGYVRKKLELPPETLAASKDATTGIP